MAINPYLFCLKPVDTFFFGGERTFGYDGERSRKNGTANYFVESKRYPQQTALLGVLRYKLLEAKDWLATRQQAVPESANDWIGKWSFRPGSGGGSQSDRSYGHIHGLSPLFWQKDNQAYLVAPKDQGMTLSWQTGAVSSYLGQGIRNLLPHITEGYKPKQGLVQQLISKDGKPFPLDDLYTAQTQEGILKTDQRTEDEQGFYKQTFYRFTKPGWSFAFVAYLADEASVVLLEHLKTNGWATLGGEGRSFRLTMEPVSNVATLFTLPERPAIDGRLRLTLLSNAFVSHDIYKNCDFAVTDTVDFRPIESNTTVQNYATLNRTAKPNLASPQQAAKYHLLERGSVFFGSAEQLAAVKAALDEQSHFCRIGYNAYQLTGQAPTLFQPA